MHASLTECLVRPIIYNTHVATVKTLYNVTRYNTIFIIRKKFAGNGSVSIKIPSLSQNIHLPTPTVNSGNRSTFSNENIFIITEFLPCFSDTRIFFSIKYLLLHKIEPQNN